MGEMSYTRFHKTAAGLSMTGVPTYVGPHSMTPQEYPPRPEYRTFGPDGTAIKNTVNTMGDSELLLPDTQIDPNHYAASTAVAPLAAAGAPNDYLDKQGTIDNADTLTTHWMDEPHDRQVLAIRNACMAAIISPRKPLMWNAAHYQTLDKVPVGAPLGDFYLAWVHGREAHNHKMGFQETAFNIPWHGEGDWRPQAKLIQEHYKQFEGMDDHQSWKQAKDYLAKLYAHFEPFAMNMLQRENEMRQQGEVYEPGVGARPVERGQDKQRKVMDENEIRMHMMTSTMVADFLKHQFASTGAPEGELPGNDLLSQPANFDDWNELLPRAAGFAPTDPRSPHGGYANSGDVVCSHCTQRTRSDQGKCEKCGQPLTGDEHPIIAGDADHDLRLQHSDWMDTQFGPGQHYDTYTGHVAAVPHRPTNKMAGFVYKHMEKLPELTNEVCDQLLAYAKKDVEEDNGRGYIWRAGVHAVGVPGLDNKTASYAWLMLAPHTSELGIIDTHAARSMGFHDNDIEGNGGANYYAMERMQRHMKDSTGYGDLPLGMYHWGHWDMARSPGFHSDHRGLRPLDPLEYDDPDIDYGHKGIADRKDTPIYVGPPEFMSQLPAGHAVANQWLQAQGLQPLPEPMNLDANNVSMQPDEQALGLGTPPDVRAAGLMDRFRKQQPQTGEDDWQPTDLVVSAQHPPAPRGVEVNHPLNTPEGWSAEEGSLYDRRRTPWVYHQGQMYVGNAGETHATIVGRHPELQDAYWSGNNLDDRGSIYNGVSASQQGGDPATAQHALELSQQHTGSTKVSWPDPTKQPGTGGWAAINEKNEEGFSVCPLCGEPIIPGQHPRDACPNRNYQRISGLFGPKRLPIQMGGDLARDRLPNGGSVLTRVEAAPLGEQQSYRVIAFPHNNDPSGPHSMVTMHAPDQDTANYLHEMALTHLQNGGTTYDLGSKFYDYLEPSYQKRHEPQQAELTPEQEQRYQQLEGEAQDTVNSWMEEPAAKTAGWEEDAQGMKGEINVEDYLAHAEGNSTAAIRALHEDLVESHGYDPQVAWMIARNLVENHEAKTPTTGEGVGHTDMSQFENAGTTEPATNMDWAEQAMGPTNHTTCPNCQGQLETIAEGEDGRGIHECKACGHQFVEDSESDELHDMGVNQKRKFSPEGLDQLPAFPEPTGETVPDTMPSDWS